MTARITSEPIDPEALRGAGAGDGAELLFLGVVRNHAEGRPVRGMRYEAYGEMAERVLAEIVREAEARHAVSRVAAVHRVGELAVGEVSVAILVAAPHRDAAYGASRFVIEQIKRRLPVWKHEHFADGASRWVAGVPLAPESAG
ncbi:MAG: molybdenum cofactor biosynthesis protein MoaE [Longimicrobiales bacterium]|nr:molybdenum cofactor biosynthesis protein MoaE [Longimicrobiales bacterium]